MRWKGKPAEREAERIKVILGKDSTLRDEKKGGEERQGRIGAPPVWWELPEKGGGNGGGHMV